MSAKPTYRELENRIEQLQAEKAQQFSRLLKNSFDMIILIDSDGIQRYVSESCIRILGYRPEELTDIPVIEKMIHPDDQENVRQGFYSIVNDNKHGGAQYRHKHKDGGWVYLEAFGNNQLDNPHIKSVVLNVRDITERKKAEEKLKESELRLNRLNAMKDRLFSIIGHDLRTPFSNIVGLSEILLEHIQNNEFSEAGELAVNIQDSSEKALSLLNNLLEWARMQTGNVTCLPEPLNFAEIVSDSLQLYKEMAAQKSIRIVNRVPENLKVKADKKMVGTLLRNLISNSLKFSHPNGEIIIGASNSNDKVTVSVADQGVGMDEDTVNQLFSNVLNNSTDGTNNEPGTGLGLLLCKELIEMHDGKIWVESKPGEGSTFYFLLPLVN